MVTDTPSQVTQGRSLVALIEALDHLLFFVIITGVLHIEPLLMRLLHAHEHAWWIKGLGVKLRHSRSVLTGCHFFGLLLRLLMSPSKLCAHQGAFLINKLFIVVGAIR